MCCNCSRSEIMSVKEVSLMSQLYCLHVEHQIKITTCFPTVNHSPSSALPRQISPCASKQLLRTVTPSINVDGISAVCEHVRGRFCDSFPVQLVFVVPEKDVFSKWRFIQSFTYTEEIVEKGLDGREADRSSRSLLSYQRKCK